MAPIIFCIEAIVKLHVKTVLVMYFRVRVR